MCNDTKSANPAYRLYEGFNDMKGLGKRHEIEGNGYLLGVMEGIREVLSTDKGAIVLRKHDLMTNLFRHRARHTEARTAGSGRIHRPLSCICGAAHRIIIYTVCRCASEFLISGVINPLSGLRGHSLKGLALGSDQWSCRRTEDNEDLQARVISTRLAASSLTRTTASNLHRQLTTPPPRQKNSQTPTLRCGAAVHCTCPPSRRGVECERRDAHTR
ncbi:hypothetical protein TcasGA2_TC003684 [Tribolium castaneum]|uniref:Uncharacterized protein n=1 Tax=Tribolium castaneum TaxID=7070 RepID=D6WDL9_TRICA|nr:hypothetical protein TcasGA2_TC003684 [Tribolium castaneum]